MTEDQMKKDIQKLIELRQSGNDTETLKAEAIQLLKVYPDNDSVKSIVAGILIDSGNILQDITAVNKGIVLIGYLLKDISDTDQNISNNLNYNLSNGYSSSYEIHLRNGNETKALQALQQAKSIQQKLLIDKEDLAPQLLAAVMTNYANTLDHLGRTIESIDVYMECIDLFPNHAMAIGNCGIAFKRIIGLSEHHAIKNLYKSWDLLTQACNMKTEILEFSSQEAINWFESHLKNLIEHIDFQLDDGIEGLKQYSQHRQEVHGHPKCSDSLTKVKRERLLLTMNLSPLESAEECIDDLVFKKIITIGGSDGLERFSTIANSLNLMKEEFATARYLYFLAKESQDAYYPMSNATNYVGTADYSDFGLQSGLFKASFRLAADCLDKVAVFINDYFELGHPVDFIQFSNVWFIDRQPKKGLHSTLSNAAQTNHFLSALLDVKRDWYLQSMPGGKLRDVRNKTTHSKLILHWMYHDKQSQDLSHWNADDFQKITMFMLRIAKASIMYTILAVDIEEGKRESTSNNSPKLSMPVNINSGLSDRSFDDEIE